MDWKRCLKCRMIVVDRWNHLQMLCYSSFTTTACSITTLFFFLYVILLWYFATNKARLVWHSIEAAPRKKETKRWFIIICFFIFTIIIYNNIYYCIFFFLLVTTTTWWWQKNEWVCGSATHQPLQSSKALSIFNRLFTTSNRRRKGHCIIKYVRVITYCLEANRAEEIASPRPCAT